MGQWVHIIGDNPEKRRRFQQYSVVVKEHQYSQTLVKKLVEAGASSQQFLGMGDQRSLRAQRIEEHLIQLENWSPSYLPKTDPRQFINDLLQEMVAEATDLREERKFRESANMLHRTLQVYLQQVYPLHLQNSGDDARVSETRLFKATMSVFAGRYQWAIEEASFVIDQMDSSSSHADQRRAAQRILSVAKAGMDLLKFRDCKNALTKQREILRDLKGTGQEEMINHVRVELDKELGPFVEADGAVVNQSLTPDPELIPVQVEKDEERMEAKEEEETKDKCSRPSCNQTDSSAQESSSEVRKAKETVNTARSEEGSVGNSSTGSTPSGSKSVKSKFCCVYCKVVFDEKWHQEQHLKSPGHIAKINSDHEKNWQHRDPPSHVTNGVYNMCSYHATGLCRYSCKPDDENLCDYAHSDAELAEWTERHKYRMMKIDKVREQRLFSFLDELIQAYNFTNKKEEVMTKELPGIEVTCLQDLEVTIPCKERSQEGSYSRRWQFLVIVFEQKKLKRVGLLYDEHRHYFYLSHPSGEERPQICPGSQLVIDPDDRSRYSFEVLFTSDVLGRFHQWVILDFDERPALYVPLVISIGSEAIKPHVVFSSVDIKEPWNETNSVIIEYPAREPEDPFYQYLRGTYPPPIAGEVKLDEGHKMTHRNVINHYHKMLVLEEVACNERLKKFSGRTKLEVIEAITEDMYQQAPEGELFGKISLINSLLDDSEASQIVVWKVCFALLKFDAASNIVYQAKVLTDKALDLRRDDSIYISLGAQCVREQGLDPNKKNLEILLQFQLDRMPFCEMHFGADRITEMKLIFPPANMPPRLPLVTRDECGEMNPRQASVSKYIVEAHQNLPFLPGPTMIIGPFGTGKTETMAKTMIKLLRQSPHNKILVCTHSNSAADWLITHYLHPFLVERQKQDYSSNRKLLRMYSTIKDAKSVDKVILQNYAIFKEGTNQFRKPTFKDIIDSHIVVTTLSTSIHLVAMNEGGKTIKGFFEHIFITQAGRALETEVIIPLGLAVRQTMVVMAGDHIQMRPKVYSEVARKHSFHMSMLERLFLWDHSNQCNNVCFLTWNYRMIGEILRFIAKYQYHNKLVTKSNHYRHKDYHPMSFLTVKGTDQLIGTSYVNTAEVNAVVEKVQELVLRWPAEWGKEHDITVISPYSLQVVLIRKKLRKQGLGHINVERVQNVQGKEFRAVFISTVRTRNTLDKAQIQAISSSGQESHNENYYYGLLSDEGELITAFTRCQCLLYVVGDPVALCSVGDCRGTWEKYIKECEINNSLYPCGMTLDSIRQEVGIDDEILEELQIQVKKDEDGILDALKEEQVDENDDNDSFILETSADETDNENSSGLTSDEEASLGNDDEYVADTPEVVAEERPQQEATKANFRMVDRDGDVFLIRHNRDTSNLQSANDFGANDSDEEKDFLETKLNEDQTDEWLRMTLQQPDFYKICTIRFDPSGRVYGILADGSTAEEIVISSSRRRERALDGDKVVMHILHMTDGSYEVEQGADTPHKVYGEVKHILERSIHPKFKKVVCTIDPINHDLMCPIDPSFPKMFPVGRNKNGRFYTEEKGLLELQIYKIEHYGNGKFRKDKLVKVKYTDIPRKLFVVQYYEWFPNTTYPVGIITEMLPPCDSPKNAIRILKLMHGVKDQRPPHFAKEIDETFPEHWTLPKSELIARKEGDFRDKAVFTIGPSDAQDLCGALHVERLQDGRMRVGVHIADVSYFVTKNSHIDIEARKRATTFYPAFYASASHMLPSHFSNSLCSLLPGEEKLSVSAMFTFDRDGRKVGDPQILRSIISSVARLSYKTVDHFLLNQSDDCGISQKVGRQILDLHNLTSGLRMQRLGDGCFFQQPEEWNEDVSCTMAHTLVEEMMICANEAVAKFLVGHYGMDIPVLHQLPPDHAKAQEWLANFEKDVSKSLRLPSILPLIKGVTEGNRVMWPIDTDMQGIDSDSNNLPDSDASDFSTDGLEEQEESVPLTKATWKHIMSTLDNINHTHLDFQNIIGNEEGHPKQAIALSQLSQIMDGGLYSIASELIGGCHHCDLQTEFYTHFTAPIRRYIDLEVHRMVTAALNGDQTPYTPRELADICHHCNNQSIKAKKYTAMSHCILYALKLKLAAEPKLGFIESTDDSGFQMMYPHEGHLKAFRTTDSIPLELLKPAKTPENGDVPNSVVLYFKSSVYDTLARVPELREVGAFLKTDRFIQAVPLSSWQEILTCVEEQDWEGLEDILHELRRLIQGNALAVDTQASRIVKVTCEVWSRNHSGETVAPRKYAEFRCDFMPGQVIQVQMASEVQGGLLVPRVQLVNITPKLSFCIEHREHPVECFAELANKHTSKCHTITQYVDTWLPVVEMMAVYNAVTEDETKLIRDVKIYWFKRLENETVNVHGCFSLDKAWCDDRQIQFCTSFWREKWKGETGRKSDVSEANMQARDFLCIRIEGYHVTSDIQLKMKCLEQKPGQASSDNYTPHCGTMTLVMHGVTTSVTEEKREGRESLDVEFKVHQSACDIPEELFKPNKRATHCTVELIPKSHSDRRVADALNLLLDTISVRNLIRHTCLQRSLEVMNNVESGDVVSMYLLKAGAQFNIAHQLPSVRFHPPNESQSTAIKLALSNTFTVIQGPPGTGKKHTGALLAYFFHKINRGLKSNPKGTQILYCSASNKSVDDIAALLREFKSPDFSIVRVYSETIEHQEFPIPGRGTGEKKFEFEQQAERMAPALKDLSLHHLIRAQTAPHAQAIRKFDRKFADSKIGMTKQMQQEIEAYERLLSIAVEKELQKHQVILCTCDVAGRASLKSANILQLIIDQAGMCSELETLIPMVNHNPCQVVLIGDHLQLRPTIREPHAKELGAGMSLMEKYKQRAYMLNVQYRMHEEICRFISQGFYEGALQTATAVKNRATDLVTRHIWPNGPTYPRVFCHVVGVEEKLRLPSEEGIQMSFSNLKEVNHVVRIAKYFIHQLGVDQDRLVILSQYIGQCRRIEEAVTMAGLAGVTVSTVVKSQGSEWDYVIFSTVRSLSKIEIDGYYDEIDEYGGEIDEYPGEIDEYPDMGCKMNHLGLTMDENQMIVAMSRARKGHIVVGNKFLLGTHTKWAGLLRKYKDTRSLLPAVCFPRKVFHR